MIIKWTNKYSGEQGYVKSLNRQDGYFENTFDENEAESYSEKNVNEIIELLYNFCSDNNYQTVVSENPKHIEKNGKRSCEGKTARIADTKDFKAYKSKFISKGVKRK